MQPDNADKAIASLLELLKRESLALKNRRFEKLAELNEKKEHILLLLEDLLPKLSGDSETKKLISSLESLAEKAKENAVKFAQVKTAISDLRARVETLCRSENESGVYCADGRKIAFASNDSLRRSI